MAGTPLALSDGGRSSAGSRCLSQNAGSTTCEWVGPGVGLGGVWLRVGVGDGVEDAGIAAEGAEDVGGGLVAAEDDAPLEQPEFVPDASTLHVEGQVVLALKLLGERLIGHEFGHQLR